MRLRCLLLLALAAGCEGNIVPGGIEPNGGTGGAGAGTGAGTGGSGASGGGAPVDPPNVACDTSQYPMIRLEAIAADFARDVYPAMARQSGGCATCHAPNMGRMFLVTA